jgi:hypothetical protein
MAGEDCAPGHAGITTLLAILEVWLAGLLDPAPRGDALVPVDAQG